MDEASVYICHARTEWKGGGGRGGGDDELRMGSDAMVKPAPHAGAQSPRDITGAVHTRRWRLLVVEARLGWAGGMVVVHGDGGGGRRGGSDVVREIEAEVGWW